MLYVFELPAYSWRKDSVKSQIKESSWKLKDWCKVPIDYEKLRKLRSSHVVAYEVCKTESPLVCIQCLLQGKLDKIRENISGNS